MNDKVLKVLLIEDNAVSAQMVKMMLTRAEASVFNVQTAGTLIGALDALGTGSFDVILLDLGLPDSDGLSTLATIRVHAPQVPVLVLTGSDSEALSNSALQHGAQDYIVKGQFDAHSLSRALRYAVTRHRQASEHLTDDAPVPRAKLIGVLGAKGGSGGTTLAMHLALETQRITGQEVLLIDLDVIGGSVGFLMKVNHPYTVLDVSINLHRLDAALWQSLAWKHSSGVDVLQSPGSMRFGERLSDERLRHLLHFAQTRYGSIIIDLGRFNELSISLLGELSELCLISTADVPSLFEVKRILQKIAEQGHPPGRIRVILNRASKGDLDVPELEKTFGMSIDAFCPEATRELHDAYAAGNLLPAGSALRKQIAVIAREVSGIASESARPAGRGFLGLLRRPRSKEELLHAAS